MKRLLTFLMMVAAMPLWAQDYHQDRTVKIWDNSSAPHSNGITEKEYERSKGIITSITEATLYIYEADKEKATGQAIVICPGGGYINACMDYEGYMMAEWLNTQGITCGVLKYRMPNGHKEIPLEDAVEALRTMRKMSKELNIDPAKVGIMGFSAGGHLAAYTSNFAPEGEKPAFSILFYPVITGEWGLCHKGSFDNLLGADASETLRAEYSLENRITKSTPPALLLLSDHDTVVPTISSIRYYNALKKHGIEAAMHIYPEGYHGWGIREDFPYIKQWQAAMVDWLAGLNKK